VGNCNFAGNKKRGGSFTKKTWETEPVEKLAACKGKQACGYIFGDIGERILWQRSVSGQRKRGVSQ